MRSGGKPHRAIVLHVKDLGGSAFYGVKLRALRKRWACD